MAETPLYVGIDLGTTNSAAAVFDGERVSVVRNAQGATVTPSVVRIDKQARVTVGTRARRFIEQDPVTKRYRLGFAVLDVAAAQMAGFHFLGSTAAEIQQLSAVVGESIGIHVLDGHEMVCVNFVEAAQPVRVSKGAFSRR